MSLFPITRMSILNPISDFDRIFDTLMDGSYRSQPRTYTNVAESVSTVPRANILEEKGGFAIELAAPGFSRGDFVIEVNDNTLTVSVSSEDNPEYADKLMSREYSYTSFSRNWNLPENVSINMIDAHYEAGVLTVNIPVETKATKKLQIEVQ